MIKDKHNILYISSLSSLQGGGQRSLWLMIKYLDRDKFNPFLVVPKEDELAQETLKLGVRIFVLPFSRLMSFNPFSFTLSFIRLFKIIRRLNINIIHTDCPRETIYAALVAKLLHARVIFHARIQDFYPWLDKIIYQLVDAIIAVSCVVGARFRSIDKKNKVKVVYNGVELDRFKPTEGLKKDKERFMIGYFGKIESRKGIEVLIKAVKKVSREIRLIIRGDGNLKYTEELKCLCEGIEVVFLGYKKDITSDIANVDIVVLPTLGGEGLSRIIIESMAMGKLVVVSGIPENKEALGDTFKEFVFPAGDSDALAHIIERIMDNKRILFEKKVILRKRAEQFFDIKENTQKIESIYESLLKK